MSDPAKRTNNFDAIRLVAALTVLVGHSWSLTGRSGRPALLGIPAFTMAVWVFFSVSGYLIASSWIRDPRLVPYLARRAGRILPALGMLVLVTVFVVGPAVSSRSLALYFQAPDTWRYLGNAVMITSYDLPGVFELLPRPVVNGRSGPSAPNSPATCSSPRWAGRSGSAIHPPQCAPVSS